MESLQVLETLQHNLLSIAVVTLLVLVVCRILESIALRCVPYIEDYAKVFILVNSLLIFLCGISMTCWIVGFKLTIIIGSV